MSTKQSEASEKKTIVRRLLNIQLKFAWFFYVTDYGHTKIVSTKILHVLYGDTIQQFFFYIQKNIKHIIKIITQ